MEPKWLPGALWAALGRRPPSRRLPGGLQERPGEAFGSQNILLVAPRGGQDGLWSPLIALKRVPRGDFGVNFGSPGGSRGHNFQSFWKNRRSVESLGPANGF